uniref:Uncharacterized protein n=1 Tax=viral metagenome TaxID=1070528 RepID=A0A6M3LMG5_9ZZZZ
MFSYEFKKNNSSSLTSGTSAAPTAGASSDYTETDPIDLTGKRYDGKNLSIYIDVPTTTSPSQTSAYLDFYIAGGYNSSTTFALNYNSGTSLIVQNTATGVSQGASIEYRKFTPALMYAGGTTLDVKGIPFITLGCRSTWHTGSGVSTVNYNARLIVG